MFHSPEMTNLLKQILTICEDNQKRLTDLEDSIEDIKETLSSEKEDSEPTNTKNQEVKELKADLRKNNDFIQNMLLKLIDRPVPVDPPSNGKVTMADHVRMRNAGAVKLPG